MSEPVLQLISVSKKYILGETELHALKGVSLAVNRGEFAAVVGPSGSGKSTLLHLAAGLDKPTEGRIELLGESLQDYSDKEQARLRNSRIGFIFQSFNLIPVLSVRENVEYPSLLYKESRCYRKRVDALLEDLGIADHQHKRPAQLSGGQRQRVAIARALINEPDIVFADEPTANLDHETGNRIMDLMQQLNRKYSTTFLFSTHDPKIMDKAGRLVVIEDGLISGDGA